MKKIFKLTSALMLGAMVVASSAIISCSNDDFNTEQFTGGVALNTFGPCPVARGGELRFIGSGMGQINKITLPGSGEITDIKKISDTEIRIDVPQDAEVGYITLSYPGGQITTKTMVTYSEPISIESISPATIKPGDELTITGEYLNLMHQVCFSFIEGGDSINVAEADFVEHSRKQIKVVVPEEAVSGIVMLSDGAAMPNVVKSEETLQVILPTPLKVYDLTDAIPGSKIDIYGSYFDLVREVQMPNGQSVEFETQIDLIGAVSPDDPGSNYDCIITFTLPEDITDGAIVAIPASGVKVAIANIGVVVPSELTATPATGLRAGDIVTIKGINLDQVVSVTFPNVADAVAPKSVSGTELTIAFPAMAQSGEAILNLRSGKTVSITLITAKPEVALFNPNPVAAAAAFAMEGSNLDLVVKVSFAGGIDIEVVPDNSTSIQMIAPATAASGVLTLTMANGETVETPSLTINAPECAYITSVISEELLAGELFMANVANADKLQQVLVNGSEVQYIINNDTLYISLPSSCGKNTTITLVSSNGEISYTYDVVPATHVEIVAYDGGPRDLGTWAGEDAGGAFRIYKNVFDGVPAGAKLVFHIAPYAFTQIQINDANWTSFDILQPDMSATTAEFMLTADVLNHILTTNDGWSDTGLVIQGEGTIVSKVTIEYEQSLEETIWSGEWTCAGWNGNQDLAWGGYDWSALHAGQILTFYMTPTVADGAWWCISLRHGDNWGNLPEIPSQYDSPADGILRVELTQGILSDIIAGNGLVITGDGFILNKITIE